MQSDEATLRALLDRYHAAAEQSPESSAEAEDALFRWMKAYFDRSLRPILSRRFPATAEDTSVRYSAMVNEFFAVVLAERPDAVWQARSLAALRGFAARVISNDILDVLARRRGQPMERDPLEELAASREDYFRARHDLELEPMLVLLERWSERGAPWGRWARVLRERYIMGVDYDTLARQEQVSKKHLSALVREALEAAREELSGRVRP